VQPDRDALVFEAAVGTDACQVGEHLLEVAGGDVLHRSHLLTRSPPAARMLLASRTAGKTLLSHRQRRRR
jgi:hypothetical protein